MAKTLEIESNIDKNNSEDKKSEINKKLEDTIKKAYVLGLSNGVKTMSINLLMRMQEMKNLNAQNQLINLKKMCLDVANRDNGNNEKSMEVNNT